MRSVYLIRHGATEANEKKLYYGATNLPITDAGRAELEGLRLRGGYPDIAGAAVYTSGMLRADETLEILYPGAEHMVEPRLGEMNFGSFEMRGYEELCGDPEYIRWISGDYLENVCPGGESARQHVKRAVEAFGDILEACRENVLIVCHSGTITGIMESLFPNEGENRFYWSCPNGGGYAVLMDGKIPMKYDRIPEEK